MSMMGEVVSIRSVNGFVSYRCGSGESRLRQSSFVEFDVITKEIETTDNVSI